MNSKILEKIDVDIVKAMKSDDTQRRDALRYLKADIIKKAKDSKCAIDDDICISSIKKLVKQNTESLKYCGDTLYEKDKNNFQISLWETYLPEMLDDQKTEEVVVNIISEVGASSMKDMGKVMGKLKKEYGHNIDMSMASTITKNKLINL